jgi:magnesium chelatase family protein
MTRTNLPPYQLSLGEQRVAEAASVPVPVSVSRPLPEPQTASAAPQDTGSAPHSMLLCSSSVVDLADICGQAHAKRALEVAAAGGHALVFSGAPGFGKTLLTQTLADLIAPSPFIHLPFHIDEQRLPDLLRQAAGGYLALGNLALIRPITLLPLILHLAQSIPSVALVGEMRPCPCGYYGDPVHPCDCSVYLIQAQQKRFANMTEQSDIVLEVARLDFQEMAHSRKGETTAAVRRRVEIARERQRRRFVALSLACMCNAAIPVTALGSCCPLDAPAEKLLRAAVQQLHLSVRVYHRVLRLARTIADLAEGDIIMANHVAEAIQYRPKLGL